MADNAARRTLEFPVGDYPERLDLAYRAAQEALKDTSARTMAEGDPYLVLKAEYDALREESKAASRAACAYVVLRELSRNDYRKLKADHPPRTEGGPDVVKIDRNAGMNVDSVEDDLVHAALVEPGDSECAHDSRDATKGCSPDNPCANRRKFDEWAGNLGAGKFSTIAQEAFELMMEARRDPKSLPASPTRTSD